MNKLQFLLHSSEPDSTYKAENLLVKIAKGMMDTGSNQSCRETFIVRMRTTLPIGQQ